MTASIDVRILELVCSRLCHELIGPVTAVNNGVELLQDSGDDMGAEVAGLIASSAEQASNRLQYYRIAYGFGGEGAGATALSEVGELAGAAMGGQRTRVEWPATPAGASIGRQANKVLMNALILAGEFLPRGGVVALAPEPLSAAGFRVIARGQGVRISEDTRAAMADGVDPTTLSAKTVQAYLTRALAVAFGGTLQIDESVDGEIAVVAHFPGV